MKKGRLLSALLTFCINIAFSQKDTVSHIYFGITVIPVAVVFHTVEDTSWYMTGYVGGHSGNGGYYNVLYKTHYKPDFNIASGATFFISVDRFLDISFGIIGDILPYTQTIYMYSNKTQEKFTYYRIPVNLKFSIFKSEPVRFFLQTGYSVFGKDDRIYEGMGYGGIGVTYAPENRIWISSHIDFSLQKRNIFDKSAVFPSSILGFSISYSLFKTNNHFNKSR